MKSKCPQCNNCELIIKDGKDIGGFPGIQYQTCNCCGWAGAITQKQKRESVAKRKIATYSVMTDEDITTLQECRAFMIHALKTEIDPIEIAWIKTRIEALGKIIDNEIDKKGKKS